LTRRDYLEGKDRLIRGSQMPGREDGHGMYMKITLVPFSFPLSFSVLLDDE
jgi:hypothetical protein